jgi:hypothetical protein
VKRHKLLGDTDPKLIIAGKEEVPTFRYSEPIVAVNQSMDQVVGQGDFVLELVMPAPKVSVFTGKPYPKRALTKTH